MIMPNVPRKLNGKFNPEYDRLYKIENRERILERDARYRKANPEIMREIYRKARAKYPEKFKARDLARYYVPLGPCCELYDSVEDLQRHHPDYSKPLSIITLCRTCHGKVQG